MNNFKINTFYLSSFAIFLAAYFSIGFLHPDEQYYSLDFAFYKLGLLDSITTWEYESQIRPWTLPYFFYFILWPFKFFISENPFFLSYVAKLFSGLLGVMTLHYFIKTYSHQMGELKDRFVLFSYLCWPIIFMSVRTSSDHWSTSFFIIGLCLLLQKKRNLLFGGLMLGLAFSLRHQTGILSLSLGLWLLIQNKVRLKDWILQLSLAILFGVIIGFVFDYFGYKTFTLTPLNYLKQNLVNDKISQFGVMPWWGYFKLIVLKLNVLGLALLVGACVYIKKFPKSLETWIFIPFFVFHCFIGHKELRFLYPLIFLALVMVFRVINFKKLKKTFTFIFIVNSLFLFIVIFKPAYTPMTFYRFLYHYDFKGVDKVYVMKDRKGSYPRLEMKVYTPKNINFINGLNSDLNKFYVFTSRYADYENLHQKYQCDLEFISYPLYLLKFNYFGWRDRSNVWAFSKCKTDN